MLAGITLFIRTKLVFINLLCNVKMIVKEVVGLTKNEEYEIGVYEYSVKTGKTKWKTLYRGKDRDGFPAEYLEKELQFVTWTDYWQKQLKHHKLIFGLNGE